MKNRLSNNSFSMKFSDRLYWFFVLAFISMDQVYASSGGMGSFVEKYNLQQLIINLKSSFDAFTELSTVIAYALGIIFIGMGVFNMVKYGKDSNKSVKIIFFPIFAGAILLVLPFFVNITEESLFNDVYNSADNLSALKTGAVMNALEERNILPETIDSIYSLLRLVGLVAVIRGFYIIKELGSDNGNREASIPKAILHIIPGVILINIGIFVDVLFNSVQASS